MCIRDSPQTGRLRIVQHEIADVVGKLVTWAEFIGVTTRPLNGHLSFEMALHTNFIPPGRSQLGWINDLSAIGMSSARSVATPVSYTHLDVYKRQSCSSIGALVAGWEAK